MRIHLIINDGWWRGPREEHKKNLSYYVTPLKIVPLKSELAIIKPANRPKKGHQPLCLFAGRASQNSGKPLIVAKMRRVNRIKALRKYSPIRKVVNYGKL